MSDSPKPDLRLMARETDAAEAAGAYPNFPPLPPNSCTLGTRPAQDGVHTFLRLTHDVTAMSEDGQKLLAYMVGEAFDALKKAVAGWNRIEVAAKLAQRERVAAVRLGEKGN